MPGCTGTCLRITMRLPDTSAVERRAMRGLTRARLSDTHEVLGRESREQAIALARKHRPDVVLLDPMMPKFSGFELCRSCHALT